VTIRPGLPRRAGWRAATGHRGRAAAALLAALLVAGSPGEAQAQAPERVSGHDSTRDRVRESIPGAEARVERMAAIVRERLGLTEAQGARLREVTGRFAALRERALREERTARRALRAELARGAAADQDEVERQLEALLALQGRRIELVRVEQRELARFLTPVQRAEFFALQERAFRAAHQLRMRRDGRHPEGAGSNPGLSRGVPPR
jgi:Spy/CpxP family protein refolding chaperone